MRRAVGIAFRVIVGTVITGAAASRFSRSSYFGSPSASAEPPAIVVDHDADVIRIVEGCRTAIERGIVELPLRRSDLPDELRKIVPVFFVARPAAFGGEIILVPPFELGSLAAAASCRLPGCRSDNRSRTPCALQRSGHSAAMMLAVRAPQSKPAMIAFSILRASINAIDIDSDRRLLAVAECFAGKKSRRAIAAQIRDDHPVAGRRQQRRDIDDSCECRRASRAEA